MTRSYGESMIDPFDPHDPSWTGVSPRLATARIVLTAVWTALAAVVVAAALAMLATWTSFPLWSAAVPGVLALGVIGVTAWWAPRNRRAWGYREDADDLLVRSGVLFRRVVAVPYGRMQFVDLNIGPVARRFGYARVSLHSASTKTAAVVPGVPHEEALRLRHRLTELGESRGAGL